MRWAVLAVIVGLSGCVQANLHAEPATPTLPNLNATYHVDTISTYAGERHTSSGTYTVVTAGIRTFMDRDESVRDGYSLHYLAITEKVDGNWTYDSFQYDTVLDGDLYAVRQDIPCQFGCRSSAAYVNFEGQGANPDLGVAWPWLARTGSLRLQVEGQWTDVGVRHDGEWVGLALGAKVPGMGSPAAFEFQFDNAWVPSHARLAEDHNTYSIKQWLNRTTLDIGAPQPAIKPWPKTVWGSTLDQNPTRLPGENDTANHMGITFADALDQAEASPDWKVAPDACLESMFAGWGGGSSTTLPKIVGDVLGFNQDRIQFYLNYANRTASWSFEVSYDAQGFVLEPVTRALNLSSSPYNVQGQPGYRYNPEFGVFACHALPPSNSDPIAASRKAWRLPLPKSGYPCDISYRPRFLQVVGGAQTNGGTVFSMGLDTGRGDNRPHSADFPIQGASVNIQNGEWDSLFLNTDDLAKLDRDGPASHRLLPSEPSPGVLEAASYRCVEPLILE